MGIMIVNYSIALLNANHHHFDVAVWKWEAVEDFEKRSSGQSPHFRSENLLASIT